MMGPIEALFEATACTPRFPQTSQLEALLRMGLCAVAEKCTALCCPALASGTSADTAFYGDYPDLGPWQTSHACMHPGSALPLLSQPERTNTVCFLGNASLCCAMLLSTAGLAALLGRQAALLGLSTGPCPELPLMCMTVFLPRLAAGTWGNNVTNFPVWVSALTGLQSCARTTAPLPL